MINQEEFLKKGDLKRTRIKQEMEKKQIQFQKNNLWNGQNQFGQ